MFITNLKLKIKFDSKITKTIDDTDYFYRLSKKILDLGLLKQKYILP